ncbi:MAG: cytochrome c-type biogenesis protein CcmH [Acidobacteria bacterium]|nr:cytochrome c-type biogenesis protein CcmH [Acidobacteriota bacterium]
MTTARRNILLLLLWLAPLTGEARDPRKIQDRFLAPCCWQESAAVHQSEAASQMRAEIVRMVAEGKSDDLIVEAFVATYGERILREPRGNKRLWITLIPVVLTIIAALWLVGYVRRQRRAPATVPDLGDLPVLPDVDPE